MRKKDERQRWERIRKKIRRMRKKENVREVWETGTNVRKRWEEWERIMRSIRRMKENDEKEEWEE